VEEKTQLMVVSGSLTEKIMKSSYELAEREIALAGEINTATEAGDFEKMEQLQKQLVVERKSLQSDLDEKKERIHQASARK
jgi:hypothetical protein